MNIKIWTCKLDPAVYPKGDWIDSWSPSEEHFIIKQECEEGEFPNWECCGHWYVFPKNLPLTAIEDFNIVGFCKDKLDDVVSFVEFFNDGQLFGITDVKEYELRGEV